MTHATEEQLVLYYYGESDDRDWVDSHLPACELCRRHYRAIQVLLNVMNSAPVPELAADYGAQVWARVRGAVPAAGAGWKPGWFGRFRFAPVMAALLVAAFFLGRWSPRSHEGPEELAGQPPVRERVLLVAMGDHLERSEMVLVELANAPDRRVLDISAEQRAAQDLLDTNRLLRTSASQAGEDGAAAVLEDLERVLLEIVHAPTELSAGELAVIRRRIEAQGILFKIRVLDRSGRDTL